MNWYTTIFWGEGILCISDTIGVSACFGYDEIAWRKRKNCLRWKQNVFKWKKILGPGKSRNSQIFIEHKRFESTVPSHYIQTSNCKLQTQPAYYRLFRFYRVTLPLTRLVPDIISEYVSVTAEAFDYAKNMPSFTKVDNTGFASIVRSYTYKRWN